MATKRKPTYPPVSFVVVKGKKYDPDDGTRLTDCCGGYSTFHDTTLCCKCCWAEVDFGEGDGSEINGSLATQAFLKRGVAPVPFEPDRTKYRERYERLLHEARTLLPLVKGGEAQALLKVIGVFEEKLS